MRDSFEVRLERALTSRADAVVVAFDAEEVAQAAFAGGRQRPILQMLVAAAVAALLIIGAGVAANRLIGTHPTPRPTAPTPSASPPPAIGSLLLETTYRTVGFSEPFSFPTQRSLFGPIGVSTPQTWGGPGGLDMRGFGWDIFILDDVAVNADYCGGSGAKLPDIPATPALVGKWLETSSLLVVAPATQIEVDGRIALRFDIQAQKGCKPYEAPLRPPDFYATRIYAVPTGDDTILVAMWGDPGSLGAMEGHGDEWVASFDFDEP
jgi:hypothetical protein